MELKEKSVSAMQLFTAQQQTWFYFFPRTMHDIFVFTAFVCQAPRSYV